MRRQCGITVIELLVIAGILLILIGVPVVDYSACHAKWDRSGVKSVTWGPIQGCILELPDGRHLPEERVRDFSLATPKE